MKKLSVLLGVTGLVFAGSAMALPQTKYTSSCKPLSPTEGKYEEKGSTGSISSQSAFKKLTAANEAYADGKHQESIAILNELIANSSDKVAVGRAQSLQGMNYQAIENYSAARNAFMKAIESGFLRKQDEVRLRRGIAQLYAIEENYSQAISWMERYFKDAIKPPANSYASYASLLYNSEKYREAICPAYIALEQGISSKKPMYSMLFGAHIRLNENVGAETIGEEMIELFPDDKSVYNNLFAVYSRRGKQADMLALAELARMNGIWQSETNYKQLSALFSNNKTPRLAAERLKEGINKGVVESNEDNWKRVADNYFFAKDLENAVEAYDKASSFTSSGKYDYKVAIMYQDNDDYAKAARKYSEAIRKGGLKEGDIGYAYMNLGVSQFRLGREQAAIETMKRATKYPKVAKNANAYIKYLGDLKRMRDSLAEINQEENQEGEGES
ncbi:tetratricopeptide repeat protein [Kangiella sediminilitoris]|nr:tetratricopeptide repeat protein [Kangiella sediminilitoris]